MRVKHFFIFLTLFFNTDLLFSQNQVDSLLSKLNSIHSKNRILISGSIEDIYINKTSKSIDLDGNFISLDEYTISYENSYSEKHKKIMDIIMIKCISGNCITNSKNNTRYSGYGLFFKSKKACYDFINVLDKIREILK
jgi:hypothetical protein